MALNNQILAGLMGTHQGLLGGLRSSLAPVAPPDMNDPASLRQAAMEYTRRGMLGEAQNMNTQANQMERQRMVDQELRDRQTQRTIARGDMRVERARQQQMESDAMLKDQQARERFQKSKSATADALRKQDRGNLADIVDAIEEPNQLAAIMGTIAAQPKSEQAGWEKVETEEGVFAVNSNNPNERVRIGSPKKTGKKKDSEEKTYDPFVHATKTQRMSETMDTIGQIEKLSEEVGGIEAFLMGSVPMTDAKAMTNLVTSMKSKQAFDRLQQMRDESKTGGALGQVSNVELDLLESNLAKLDPTDSNFPDQLAKIKRSYQKLEAIRQIEYKTQGKAEALQELDGQYYYKIDGEWKKHNG